MNWQTIGALAGGVGLFLIGMSLMTDGLTRAAGPKLRQILARATHNRFNAFGVGTLMTALVQSSSATTLAAIGFVSAGLLTFPAALGIILGSNLGTTSTAWIVSMIGFKIKASAFALPMIALGALIKLFSRGKHTELGMAIAGFGLVFVGIDALQAAMQSAGPALMPSNLPAGVLGTLLLVLIGAVMTIVMQSSSAAVATTLAALYAGTISFEQAAAMVIGQNVGTTVTAVLAALGGTLEAKRAAMAHILFNVITAILALILLKPFTHLVLVLGQTYFDGSPEMGIALFHSVFNLVGVAIFLPITPQFAALIERLLPEREDALKLELDPTTLQVPAVALEVARRACVQLLEGTAQAVSALAQAAAEAPEEHEVGLADALRKISRGQLRELGRPDTLEAALERVQSYDGAIDRVRGFLAQVSSSPTLGRQHQDHVTLLHAVEHIQRLLETTQERAEVSTVHHHAPLREHALRLGEGMEAFRARTSVELDEAARQAHVQATERLSRDIAKRRALNRVQSMELAASGQVNPEQAEQLMRAMRWIDRVAFHTWRASLHLYTPDHLADRAEPILPEILASTPSTPEDAT